MVHLDLTVAALSRLNKASTVEPKFKIWREF